MKIYIGKLNINGEVSLISAPESEYDKDDQIFFVLLTDEEGNERGINGFFSLKDAERETKKLAKIHNATSWEVLCVEFDETKDIS